MSRDQRAYIRMLERRIEELERIVIEAGLRRGRAMTRSPRILDGVTDEEIAAGGSGSVTIRDFNPDSADEVDTAETVTAINRYNVALPEGALCLIIERPWQPASRRWHIVTGDCEE